MQIKGTPEGVPFAYLCELLTCEMSCGKIKLVDHLSLLEGT